MLLAELRPLSLGELLDRSFTYYRKYFWVLVGIMAIPQLFAVALSVFFQALQASISHQPATPAPEPEGAGFVGYVLGAFLGILGVAIIYTVVYAVALGATTLAVSEIHLAQSSSVRSAYRKMKGMVWRLVDLIFSVLVRAGACFLVLFIAVGALGALMEQTGQGLGAILAVLGVLLAFVLSSVGAVLVILRYGVSIPALVLERISAGEALKRSAKLTKGFLGRVFLIGLMMTVVSWVVASIFQGPFLIAAVVLAMKHSQPPLWLNTLSAVAGGVGGALSGPLLMIPLALLYYDLRVRKEGFDLEVMMAALDHGSPAAVLEPQTPADSTLQLEKTSVLRTVLLSLVTLGIYIPIWYLNRRRAINNLQSAEKLGRGVFILALSLWILDFFMSLIYVAMTEAGTKVSEASFDGLSRVLQLSGAILLLIQAFKVRRILLNHNGVQQAGMFSSHLGMEADSSFSRVATFFLGIWYLQYKINDFLEVWSRRPPPSPVAEVPSQSP
ncbi:MAG TPA: DUF4234 domain-containing protein [Terriglobia bacterium]|nr:DUF4234 domain-containing protein [Terriglobia bacterium]